jgi:succinyl-diaminopimelate desuccinylase
MTMRLAEKDLAQISVLKRMILHRIDQKRDELVKLCRDVVKIPSDNPPGTTKELAIFLRGYLEERGIQVRSYEPRNGIVNLLAQIEGSKGPHLVLNAHMDQFPAETGQPWAIPPYAGKIRDGRIYGRGAGDMKGGLSALTFDFCLMKEMGFRLSGKLSLTLVSDEETGGRWGARWLIDNVSEVMGDACLNAEPSGLTARVGEKGPFFFKLRTSGKPGPGSFGAFAGENAVIKMMRILIAVERFEGMRGKSTDENEEIIEKTKKGMAKQYGQSPADIAKALRCVTVNIGVIRGGSKINIIPGTCEAQVDVRLPLGISSEEMKRKLDRRIREIDKTATIEFLTEWQNEANYTSEQERIVRLLSQNARTVTGKQPLLSYTTAATDTRFFRRRNVPSVIYGPKVYNLAAADEYISLEDLTTVAKVHAGTIIDFLST